jgi:arylsulfatase A-like enzyme
LAHIGWELNEDEVTLPMYLRAAGYETCLFGVQHETSGDATKLGYDHVEKTGGEARKVAGAVAQWLARRAGKRGPFFLSMGTNEVHRPYQRENYPSDDPEEVTVLPWLPDRPGIRLDIAGLNGLTRVLDEAVGEVMEGLEETGLAANTCVVFTTDHGLAMPRAKGTCYDAGTKTALIMRLPERWAGGVVHDELLTNCDLLPTLLELAGMGEPENLDGRSFLGLLDDGGYVPREHIFLEMTWHDKYNPMRAVRTNRYKYIRNFGERPLVYLPWDVWNGAAGREMREEYYGSRRPNEELYDLSHDPLEMNNVVGSPAYEAVLLELRRMVEEWMRESGDRLLEGDWPPTEAQRQRELRGEPN